MKQGNRLIKQLGFRAGLEGHPLPGLPIIELAGESRVLIENHLGIQEYLANSIKVALKYGFARIEGMGLEIVHMSADQLVITGKILSVKLERSRV